MQLNVIHYQFKYDIPPHMFSKQKIKFSLPVKARFNSCAKIYIFYQTRLKTKNVVYWIRTSSVS